MPHVCEGRSESAELKIKELDTWGFTWEMICFKRSKRASLLKAKFHWWKSPCVTTRKDVSCLSVHSIKVVMWGSMFIRMARSSFLHTAFTSWISFLFPSFSSSKISTTAFKTCRVSYGRVNDFFLKSWLTFISPAKKLLIASLFSGWNSRSSRSGKSDRMSLNINTTQNSSYQWPARAPKPCLSCKAMWKGMQLAQAGETQLHLQ